MPTKINLFAVLLLFMGLTAKAQLPPCTSTGTNCVCYGDFESFTSNADLASGVGGTPNISWSSPGDFPPQLQTGISGNNTQYAALASCGNPLPGGPNGGYDETPVVLPLSCMVNPCDEAIMSIDTRPINASWMAPGTTVTCRVRFLQTNPITNCPGNDIVNCPAATTDYLDVDIDINGTNTSSWQTFSQPFTNTTPFTFNYVMIWFTHTPNQICFTQYLDNVELNITSTFNTAPITLPPVACVGGGCVEVVSGSAGQYSVSGPGVPPFPLIDLQGNETWLFCPQTAGAGTHTITICEGGCCITQDITVLNSNGPNIGGSTFSNVCEGDALTICPQVPFGANYTYSWTGPGVNGQTSQCVNITAQSGNTNYFVTATDLAGCTETVAITVAADPLPNISIDPFDNFICPGECTDITANTNITGTMTWYNPNNTVISTTPGTNSATITACPITPFSSFPYTVEVTSPAGCTSTATAVVNVGGPTNVTETLSQTICETNCGFIILSVDGPFGNNSNYFSPYNGANAGNPNNGSYSPPGVVQTFGFGPWTIYYINTCTMPIGPNDITYNYQAPNQCDGSVTATIDIYPVPQIGLVANPPAICASGGTTDITVLTTLSPYPQTYSWSPTPTSTSNGGQTATVSSPGAYTVTVSNGVCPSVSETIIITALQGPIITTVNPAPICIGDCVDIVASTNIASDIVITDASNTAIFSANGVTNASVQVCPPNPFTSYPYTITATDPNTGCVSTETIIINVLPAPVVNTTLNEITCVDDCGAIVVGVDFFGNGVSNYFTPYNGATAGNPNNGFFTPTPGLQSINIWFFTVHFFIPCNNPAGTYNITYNYQTANSCVGSATGTITVCDFPIGVITPSASCGVPTTLTGNFLFVPGACPITSYNWTGPAVQGTLNPNVIVANAAGTYTLTATNAGGCETTLTYVVTPGDQVSITAFGPANPCEGQSVTLIAGGGTFTSYDWGNGNLTSTQTVTTSGTYCVDAIDANGCPSTDCYTITFTPVPVVTINAVAPILWCSYNGAPIPMSGTSTGGTCSWSEDGLGTTGNYLSATGDFTPTGPGTYSIFYTCNNNGCITTESIDIVVDGTDYWHQTSQNSAGRDWAEDVVTDADGNVYVIGSFFSNTELNGGGNPDETLTTITGFNGSYVAKYDPCGNLLWQTHTENSKENTGRAIGLDEVNGHVYASGNMDGFLQFTNAGGANVVGNYAGFSQLGYVLRIDMVTGYPEWISPFAILNYTDVRALAVDETEGSIFVGGRVAPDGSLPYYRAYAAKYTPTATGIGTANYPIKGNGEGNSVINDMEFAESTQQLWMVGDWNLEFYMSSTGGLTTPTINTAATQDAVVVGFNDGLTAPTLVDQRAGGCPNTMSGEGIALNPAGTNVYLTGTHNTDFSNIYGLAGSVLINPGGNSAYHIQADLPAGGANFWVNETDGNSGQAEGRAVDYRNGAAYFLGNYARGPITFLPVNITEQYYVLGGALPFKHVFIVAYDELGNYKWHNVTRDNVANTAQHEGYAIASGVNDQSYAVGSYLNNMGYLAGVPQSGDLNSTGGSNAFVMRNDQISGELKIDLTGSEEDSQPVKFTAPEDNLSTFSAMAYPNPTSGLFTLAVDAPVDGKQYVATIYSMAGQQVKVERLETGRATIDMGEYESGIYTIVLTDGAEIVTLRVVKTN